jgi:hypothetical protein
MAANGERNELVFKVLLDSVEASLPAYARLLRSSEGDGGMGHDAGVYSDHAEVEGLAGLEGAFEVAGEDVPGQAPGGAIRDVEGVGLVVENLNCRDWAENLLAVIKLSGATLADWVLAKSAEALMELVLRKGFARLGLCERPECGQLRFDGSRNASKRSCSTWCSNRVAVTAYRARRRETEDLGT